MAIPNPYAILAGVLLLIGTLTGVYFKGRHDVEVADAAKFAVVAQAAKDAQIAANKTDIANNYVTKESYNALSNMLAGYNSTVTDLTQRLHNASSAGRPVILPAPMVIAQQCTDPRAAGSPEASLAESAGLATPDPVVRSLIETEVLRDDLSLAIKNIQALEVIQDEASRVQQ